MFVIQKKFNFIVKLFYFFVKKILNDKKHYIFSSNAGQIIKRTSSELPNLTVIRLFLFNDKEYDRFVFLVDFQIKSERYDQPCKAN